MSERTFDPGAPCRRYVGYVRVSTRDQVETGHSLGDQREQIQRECGRRGVELVEICEDGGISGSKGREGRPGYDRMLRLLENGHACGVITAYLDRFGRGGFDSAKDVETIVNKYNCDFVCLDFPMLTVDLSSPTGKLVLAVLCAMNQFYRDQAAKKTADIAQARKRAGQAYTYTPYGYDRVGDQFQPNKDEMSVISWLLSAQRDGYSLSQIQRSLNDRGIPSKTGKPWQRSAIAQILKRAAADGLG